MSADPAAANAPRFSFLTECPQHHLVTSNGDVAPETCGVCGAAVALTYSYPLLKGDDRV